MHRRALLVQYMGVTMSSDTFWENLGSILMRWCTSEGMDPSVFEQEPETRGVID